MNDSSKITTDRIIIEDLPEEASQQTISEPTNTNPVEHLAIAGHFNVDTPNKQEDKMLQEVWQYVRSLSTNKDMFDIMWQVKHLELSLGAPRLGESRLDRLYRYAKLKRQEGVIQEQLKSV